MFSGLKGLYPSRAARPQTDDTGRPCKTPGSRLAFTSVVSLKALAQANSQQPNGLYHKCELRERLQGEDRYVCALRPTDAAAAPTGRYVDGGGLWLYNKQVAPGVSLVRVKYQPVRKGYFNITSFKSQPPPQLQ